MQVRVSTVYPEPYATVWQAEGNDTETGAGIRFGGDWRPMLDIYNALEDGVDVVAEVPDWAVI